MGFVKKIEPLSPSKKIIHHNRLELSAADIRACVAVLKSGQLAQGPKVEALERAWAQASGKKFAAAVSSGVSALRLGLHALGVKAGDEVIVPGYSCVALMNPILSLGAKPILADIVDDGLTLDPADVAKSITRRTKAVVAVHLFGMPAPVAELMKLGLPVLEDCAHGIGGYMGKHPFGSVGTLNFSSFYATKMIGAGEGGVVAGDDVSQIEKIRCARDYGNQAPDAHHLNDKLTELEAALALSQLQRLKRILARRKRIFEGYTRKIFRCGLDLELPSDRPGRIHYRYIVTLKRPGAAGVVEALKSRSVVATQPVWDLRSTWIWPGPGRLPGCAKAFDRVVSLPFHAKITEEDQKRVVDALSKVLVDKVTLHKRRERDSNPR